MRISFVLAALASAALVSGPVLAQTAPNASGTEENGGGAEGEKPAKPAKPKKICRETDQSYTRMPTRSCKTQAQWDAEDGRRDSADKLKGQVAQ
jgi:hypothetical protein